MTKKEIAKALAALYDDVTSDGPIDNTASNGRCSQCSHFDLLARVCRECGRLCLTCRMTHYDSKEHFNG